MGTVINQSENSCYKYHHISFHIDYIMRIYKQNKLGNSIIRVCQSSSCSEGTREEMLIEAAAETRGLGSGALIELTSLCATPTFLNYESLMIITTYYSAVTISFPSSVNSFGTLRCYEFVIFH